MGGKNQFILIFDINNYLKYRLDNLFNVILS